MNTGDLQPQPEEVVTEETVEEADVQDAPVAKSDVVEMDPQDGTDRSVDIEKIRAEQARQWPAPADWETRS